MAQDPGSRKLDEPRGRRHGRGWLLALLALLIVAGGVAALVIATNDSGDDVTAQVTNAADNGVDAVTSAGDSARDTVTSAGAQPADDARDTVTAAADGALDTSTDATDGAADSVTGDDGSSAPKAVQDDPVVKRLAHGRSLPFVAGPWVRARYRDTVYARLSSTTRKSAQKVGTDGRFGIRIG